MFGFTEIADRVWLAQHEWFDVNVVVVGGSQGLAVIDTLSSGQLGRELLVQAQALCPTVPVLAAVNTHQHFDHTFGNEAFLAAGVQVVAHESVAETLPDHHREVVAATRAELDRGASQPTFPQMLATQLGMPTRTFSSATAISLGDRALELVHTGRGHSAGDLVVSLPDVDLLLAGDLIEQAEPGIPGYGDDCWPLEWPNSLEVALSLTTASTTIVPGHGDPVDRQFAEDQHQRIAGVAQQIHHLAGSGVSPAEAVKSTGWPWPADALAVGIRRGYEQLPRGSRRLPLA